MNLSVMINVERGQESFIVMSLTCQHCFDWSEGRYSQNSTQERKIMAGLLLCGNLHLEWKVVAVTIRFIVTADDCTLKSHKTPQNRHDDLTKLCYYISPPSPPWTKKKTKKNTELGPPDPYTNMSLCCHHQ